MDREGQRESLEGRSCGNMQGIAEEKFHIMVRRMKGREGILEDAVVFIFVGYDDSYGDFRDCMLWGSEED